MVQGDTRAIVVRQQTPPPALDLKEVSRYAEVFYKSGLFKDLRGEAQAIVKMLYGQELGLQPMQAMLGVHVVDGRPTLAAPTIATLIKRSGRYKYLARKHDPTVCEIAFFEWEGGAWEPIGVSVFTAEEAHKAGLAGKDNWTKYPKAMLFWRALAGGARMFCPDIFGGPVYTPEEFDAVVDPETGEVIERTARDVTTIERTARDVTTEDKPAPAPARGTSDLPHPAASPVLVPGGEQETDGGTPLWVVGGTPCVVRRRPDGGHMLVSRSLCPTHGVAFGLRPTDDPSQWRHNVRGGEPCLLEAVLEDLEDLAEAEAEASDREPVPA